MTARLRATPPRARLLTGERLQAGSWGAEFDQRDFLGGLKSFCGLVLYSLPLLVTARLLWHFRSAPPPVWAWAAAGLIALFCGGGLLIHAGAMIDILTWRAWLIFSPGRIIWRRRSLIKCRVLIFAFSDILGLSLVFQHGQTRLRLKYRREDGSDASEELVREPGRAGRAALWAADLILDALAPRTVPFSRE